MVWPTDQTLDPTFLTPSVSQLHYTTTMLSKSIVAALFATGGLAASLSSPSRAGGLEHARSRIPKRRIIALTDIVAATREPDDIQSLIHVLATADVFQIDAIIATTGWNLESDPETPRIFELIDAYEKDLPNLMKRSGQTDFLADETNQFMGYWPSADYLRSVTAQGQTVRGMVGVGDGLTTNGSTLITAVVDRADPWNRPVWLSVWGGGNTLAQSLWDVGRTRLAHDVDEYVSKLRVYTVADQDRPFALGAGNTVGLNGSSHPWIRKTFGSKGFFIWSDVAWLTLGDLTREQLVAVRLRRSGPRGIGLTLPDLSVHR